MKEMNDLLLAEMWSGPYGRTWGLAILRPTGVPADRSARGLIQCKDNGVTGIEVARRGFRHLDPQVTFIAFKRDGQALRPGI